MTKVLFKKGPAGLFETDTDLDSIIFKESPSPQAPGFSEIYLGNERCGVGHRFAIGTDGLVPSPTMADIGKVLTPTGWATIDMPEVEQSDWEENNQGDAAYILNRPSIRSGTVENSIIEGDIFTNIASASYSHAEGTNTGALGEASHAEGSLSLATGIYGHAEGSTTFAIGTGAHTEGNLTTAYLFGHAEGEGLISTSLFTVSGAANATTYTTSAAHNLKSGDVISYLPANGSSTDRVVRVVTGVTETSFNVNRTLSTTALSGTTITIHYGFATGEGSHSEGMSTRSYGRGSHSEGFNTMSLNPGEHSQGFFNKSNVGDDDSGTTLHSIGIGSEDIDRKNAVEVMLNGDVYVYGVGSYDGTNPGVADTLQDAINNASMDLIPVTYSELVTLKTGGNLVPGMQYRITDYTCTTTQANTQSAGHVFDIIVTADSETELNENARAAHHEGNTISYQILPNQTTVFTYPSWMSEQSISDALGDFVPVNMDAIVLAAEQENTIYENGEWLGDFETLTPGTEYRFSSHDSVTRTLTFSASDTYFANCDLDSWELKYCLENDTNRFTWADTTNGKGVIYYMKDEWNNIAPFDFKNMLFTRDTSWFNQNQTWATNVLGSVPSTNMNFYFLSWVTQNNEVQDLSIVGQTLMNDEDAYSGVYNNEIKETTDYDMGISGDVTSTGFALPCTIIVNSYAYGRGNIFYGCYGNSFGNSCYNNTLGSYCCCNIFGDYCLNNTFGNECFGNTFEKSCESNTFGNGCSHNSFGNYFNINSFGNSCYSNIFGDECYQNSFGSSFYWNTFGNSCYNNAFGDFCDSNSFGNSCGSNLLGDHCSGNTFENSFVGNSFGYYCNDITVFDNVKYCSVTGGTQQSPVKNAQILNGTKGASESNKLTITFTANKNYTQVAGLVNGTTLRIWIAEDTVTGPTTATDAHIALFDGTTGKIIKDSGVTVADLQVDVPEYTIEKLNQAETGYASSYILKKDNTQVGATINIPKDMVVSSGEVKTVTTANVPYQGAQVGDKYIDLTIANSSNQHIYIPVKDLMDVYTEGNGIDISASNVVSIQLDSANANGLATTSAGLKLSTVTTTAAGAMSAADKVKLDSINGNYWGSQTLSAAANYITTPEFKQVTINGSTTNAASTDHCVMVYDTTNKCVKFTF